MAKPTLYGGRWKTVGGLGEGGQGHVFRAVDTTGQLPGEFALKRVRNPERHDRFRNEIEATKRLSHPNIIRLIDHSALSETSFAPEEQFLVMPIAEGGDLSDRDRLTLYTGSVQPVLQVAEQIARALEVAHAAGVVHRDIKPGNILFTGKGHNICVSDFGICLIRGADRSTETGEVVGPRGFMAPELEEGGCLEVTPAADIYSLGQLIFYSYSGGRVVHRRPVHDEQYDALFANGDRAQHLRLLLDQMICPLDRRLKTMNEVMQRLQAINDWERNAHLPAIGPAGLAGIEELRRRSRRKLQVASENESAREQERRTLAAVKERFESWLEAELAGVVSRSGSDENIEFSSGEIGDTGNSTRLAAFGRNQAFVPVTTRELRLRLAEEDLRRIHRLQVHLCEVRTIVSGTAYVVGHARPQSALRPAEDPQLAMVPVYNRTMLGHPESAYAQLMDMTSPFTGFLTKKAAVGARRGTVHASEPRSVVIESLTIRPFVVERVTGTFHPEFSQCVRFRASEWLAVSEALKVGLSEAVDTFVDFVLSGATSIGA
jgi:serine/threonine protein kinase